MYLGKFIDKYYNLSVGIIINCMILSFEKHISGREKKMAFFSQIKKSILYSVD